MKPKRCNALWPLTKPIVFGQIYANVPGCHVFIGLVDLPAGLQTVGKALMATGAPEDLQLQHKAAVASIAAILPIVGAGGFQSK